MLSCCAPSRCGDLDAITLCSSLLLPARVETLERQCAQLLQDSATVSAAATEGDLSVGRGSTWLLGCVVAVNGVLYWTESICACMCNNRVSPLPYAVLDSVRRLAIVTSSFFLYGRQPTPMNIAGIVMVLSGALIYVWTLAQVKSAASTSASTSAMAKKQK